MKLLLIFVIFVCYISVQGSDAKQPPMDVGTTDCLCGVTANIAYVCGSNGVTYSNPSALNCAEKCTGKTITQVHDGPCTQFTLKTDTRFNNANTSD